MRRRRGFTLLETLAAAALAAIAAAACLPLMVEAARAAAELRTESAEAWDDVDLAGLADRIAARPEDFGIDPHSEPPDAPDTPDAPHDPFDASVPWPDHPDRPPALVSRLRGGGADGAWLRIACGRRLAVRWIALEDATRPAPQGGSR